MSTTALRGASQRRRTRRLANLDALLGALAVLAVVRTAVIIAAKAGYITLGDVPGLSGSVGAALVPVLAVFALRWFVTIKRLGTAATLRHLVPWGLASAALGLLFLIVSAAVKHAPSSAGLAATGIMSFLSYLFAMLSLASGPAANRVVAFVVYISFIAALASTAAEPSVDTSPARAALHPVEIGEAPALPRDWEIENFDHNAVVPADRAGLLAGNGTGVTFEKIAIGNEWRNAALLSDGGFFSAKVDVPEGASLEFAPALRAEANSGRAEARLRVTAHRNGENTVLAEMSPVPAAQGEWKTTRVPLGLSGKADIVFEADGLDAKPLSPDVRVIVAGARIASPRAKDDKRPNIILVVSDALRADRLGAYGYEEGTSPEIDRLAKDGVLFEQCFAQSPWTLPSVATIMTGLYPSVHGLVTTDRGLSEALDSLPALLSAGGYRTRCLMANNIIAPQIGMAKGFDEFVEYPIVAPDESRKLYAPAETITADALSWLESSGDGPFVLYLHFMDTHGPYEPPDEYREFGGSPSNLYDAEIKYFSKEFGKLMDELAGSGRLSDTVVILTSDHGEQFLEHGFESHGHSLYVEELRVPLVFWLPDTPGRRISSRVATIDLPSTIAELTSSGRMPNDQGRSLARALSGAALGDETVYSELHTLYPRGQWLVSLRTGRYTFILNNPGIGYAERVRLFDVESDNGEQVNVASSLADVLPDMKGRARSYAAQQAALHGRLVPVERVVPLTEEKRAKLMALGYLMPTK